MHSVRTASSERTAMYGMRTPFQRPSQARSMAARSIARSTSPSTPERPIEAQVAGGANVGVGAETGGVRVEMEVGIEAQSDVGAEVDTDSEARD